MSSSDILILTKIYSSDACNAYVCQRWIFALNVNPDEFEFNSKNSSIQKRKKTIYQMGHFNAIRHHWKIAFSFTTAKMWYEWETEDFSFALFGTRTNGKYYICHTFPISHLSKKANFFSTLHNSHIYRMKSIFYNVRQELHASRNTNKEHSRKVVFHCIINTHVLYEYILRSGIIYYCIRNEFYGKWTMCVIVKPYEFKININNEIDYEKTNY